MARTVGVDLGSRRIGVAVSDGEGRLATPYSVVERSADPGSHRRAIAAVVDEVEADRVVVGLPLSLDGTMGPAAQATMAEVAALAEHLHVPVATVDERLTTVSAQRSLVAAGVGTRQRRKLVDGVAAAVILQAWLDGRAARAGA